MAPEHLVTHPTTLAQMACRLQHHWSRSYKPSTSSPELEFGLAIHVALAKYHELGKNPVKAFRNYARRHDTPDVDLGVAMLRNYLAQYKDESFEVLATEKEIARRVPVPYDETDPPERAKHFYVGAIIDTIVLDKKLGKTFVLEHKTFGRFFPGGFHRDHQFMIEAFVAEGWLGQPIAGVLYNGLRKKAKPSATTKLFERHPIYVNKAMIRTMLHRVYWSLIESTADDYHVYPEPSTTTCMYCKFKSPCTEYMRGGDWEFLLENTFVKREASESEWAAE